MATAIIYVFSGTGNTFLAAKMIKKRLESNGIKTRITKVRQPLCPPPSPDGYDYAGFGYPVHAFNCPQIFFSFVKSLPPSSNKKAFIFKTSGEPFRLNDVSSYKLIKLLKKKGYDITLEQHLLMPYNIVFRYQNSLAKQMYVFCEALCALLVKRLLTGERGIPKFHMRHIAASLLFRIQWPGARFNGRLYSINKKRCTLCMRCVVDCPSGNISLKNGKINFDGKCAMCMRCAMLCPADAVNIGLLRFWKVNGAYDFQSILRDPFIPFDFINANTKGYFSLFRDYYKNAESMLAGQGIRAPVNPYLKK